MTQIPWSDYEGEERDDVIRRCVKLEIEVSTLKQQLKRQTELETNIMTATVTHLKARIAELVEAGWTLNELAEGRRLGQPVSKTLHGRVQAARKLLNPGA